MQRSILSVLISIVFLAAGCKGQSERRAPEITGGGSSFIKPMMIRWAHEYGKAKEVKVNYQSLGSAGGIIQLTEQAVDFACTDGPLTDVQLRKAQAKGGEVVYVPLVLGAVVPAYNLEGVEEPLHFTGAVLADIYLGKIKKWNDKALQELNPKATLPDKEIVVVHRSDGSGTTYIWTDYLSKVSPEWKDKVRSGFDVAWPTGVGKDGNEGVAGHVRATPGAIGYIELAYAYQDDIKFGLVQNRDGQFIKATLKSITAAADHSNFAETADPHDPITNAAGKESYPISGASWAVFYAKLPADKKEAVIDFLRWSVHDGQQYDKELFFAELPAKIVERVDKKLDQIEKSK